jgi:hypothetical protein
LFNTSSNKWIFVVSKFYASEWVKDLHESGEEVPPFEEISNYRGERMIKLMKHLVHAPSVVGKSRLSKFLLQMTRLFW